MTTPVILHVTFDFPSPLAAANMTRAVSRLVDGADRFTNIVYSMTRVSWRTGIHGLRYAPERTAIAYGGHPKGVSLYSNLKRLAAWILDDLREQQISVDLIHAHKFSTDGIVAYLLADALKRPMIASVWGNADGYIMAGRPDLATLWREVADRAELLLPAAPWTKAKLTADLRLDSAKLHVQPIVTEVGTPVPSTSNGGALASIFHLDWHREKNAIRLFRAIESLSRVNPDLRLDIYGGGSASAFYDVSAAAARIAGPGRVHFKGSRTNAEIRRVLPTYAGLVLPSLRETFGMVYVEALFAGIPVLYPARWAIDGFFDPKTVGYACDARDESDIATGIEHIVESESELKRSISGLQAAGEFDFLKPERIMASYQALALSALG